MPKKIDHDSRRREIAEAAASVIGTQGIDNTRLVDVARAAKATTGAITHYFEGKDAVLLAALDHVAQQILRGLKIEEPRDIVERASYALPIDEDGMRDWRVWLCFFGRAGSDPALARINKAYYEEFESGTADLIRQYQREGRLSQSIDPIAGANAVITAVDGLGVRATLEPENWPPERQKAQLEAMLRPLFPAP
ncbi:TetR/AcrR family transcriptional regulator [Tepidicaulis sp. LMO-SS28]|uniref:TetR/AcrR family transcriptional regulator n=1 Tax=Tepidicaulis sp. LMO-SS28 TaxID=3447455 RepID=UPI003EE2E53E